VCDDFGTELAAVCQILRHLTRPVPAGKPEETGSPGVETWDERKWMQFRAMAVIEGTSPWTVARHAGRPNRYQK
jgi:hypothetical protein